MNLEQNLNRGPCAHIAEGFGHFNPPDNARFVVIARASLMESQNHLGDLVDRGYISEAERVAVNELAVIALQETTGVLEVIGHLESTFGITVEDAEMLPENLDSIQRISDFVKRKQG